MQCITWRHFSLQEEPLTLSGQHFGRMTGAFQKRLLGNPHAVSAAWAEDCVAWFHGSSKEGLSDWVDDALQEAVPAGASWSVITWHGRTARHRSSGDPQLQST